VLTAAIVIPICVVALCAVIFGMMVHIAFNEARSARVVSRGESW